MHYPRTFKVESLVSRVSSVREFCGLHWCHYLQLRVTLQAGGNAHVSPSLAGPVSLRPGATKFFSAKTDLLGARAE